MTSESRISQSDRIPIFQKLGFAAGSNFEGFSTGLALSVLWMPFFNIGLGISPVVLSAIFMALLAWNAVIDPVMGNITDNARTRWGRRRPFMFVAAITTALVFPLLWHLPQSVRNGNSWLAGVADYIPFLAKLGLASPEKAMSLYLFLIGMIFYASVCAWCMPYNALQLELTPDYDERTRLTAWMTFFNKLGSLMNSWVLFVVMLAGMLALGDPKALEGKPEFLQKILTDIQPALASLAGSQPGEKPVVIGVKLVCWLLAVIIVCVGLFPALFARERYYKSEGVRRQARDPFWKNIAESSRCVPLWALIAITFFVLLSTNSTGTLGQYVNFYYVCDGDLAKGALITGVKGSVLVVTGIACIPLFTWLGEKFDKRTMLMAMLGCTMGGHLLNYFLMTPAHPWLQIISGVFEFSAVSAVWLFIPSMKADVADWDELHTARRREGSINAFFSFFFKCALTVAMGLGGVVLQLSGFDAKLAGQPGDVTLRMFHLYLILSPALCAAGIAIAWFYPLDRTRSAQIRATLEARRGAL
ncbi:MAG: MFS transporter [Opitutaceae bacterium]|jgi:GPH family glycoside/pentoside/hexuronide:cation symporter|nr:MFS transporter [Opitutaceae bacterium]